jgi:methionyl-tRNA synthetase
MSKSRGNIVRAEPIHKVMGTDALRYFLLREVVFGQDGSFSYDALIGRYNSELANGLGNLVSRTLTMIGQYRGGAIPGGTVDAIAEAARHTIVDATAAFDAFEFTRGLEAVWVLLSKLDKFIVERAPWKLARQPEAQAELDATLYTAAEALRIATVLLSPVLPQSTPKIWAQLGMTHPLDSVHLDALAWGQLPVGQNIGEVSPVFPRIEAKEAIAKMQELEAIVTAEQNVMLGKSPKPETPAGIAPIAQRISIDDFSKVDMRVGQILSAEPVKGADKLLHLKVDIGEPQPRTIVAGIAETYTSQELIGRKVVIVANLQPRKLRGIESNGMIVAGSIEGGKPVLAGFLEDVPIGARLK